MKTAIDLCCGLGGWTIGLQAAGYHVTGVDIVHYPEYPGDDFILQDVRMLDGSRFKNVDLIVASPPCTEFSRMRYLHKHLSPPDMSIVNACIQIGKDSGRPFVMENAIFLQDFYEPAVTHRGPYYLWGDVPLLPSMRLSKGIGAVARQVKSDGSLGTKRHKKLDRTAKGAARRAVIPFALSFAVGKAHYEVTDYGINLRSLRHDGRYRNGTKTRNRR